MPVADPDDQDIASLDAVDDEVRLVPVRPDALARFGPFACQQGISARRRNVLVKPAD